VAALPATASPSRTVDEDPPEGAGAPPGWPTLAAAVGAAFVLWGLLIGIQPLDDNSFLTHLATGRLIVDGGGIPRVDPYSFTATGEPWVVQSWLASLLYGMADALGGLDAVRVLEALLAAGLAAFVWHLARPARLLPRIALAGLVVSIGVGVWTERPLLIGLVVLAAVLALAQGRGDPRWVVPLMWIWVNSHGSFPLGFVAVGLLLVGSRLDGDRRPRELRLLGWMVAGTLLGAVNPLGPRLLLFPLELLRRSEQFRLIEEWKPLRMDSVWAFLFVAQVVVAVALVARRRSWRTALPLVVFTGLAFMSARNLAVASIVLLPGMAAGAVGVGTLDGLRRSRAALGAVAACVVAGCVLGVAALGGADARLDDYPEEAVTWLQENGLLEDHVVAPDYVGNYLEARYGARQLVFVDDRVDMYPEDVIDDWVVLLRARPGWEAVLDRYDAGAVLWPKDKPLTPLLRRSGEWEPAYRDADWIVWTKD
jgi:hypothetical protein